MNLSQDNVPGTIPAIASDTKGLLEHYTYLVSHDMQEATRMIMAFSDILQQDYGEALNEEGQEYLAIIHDAGKRIRKMNDEYLQYLLLENHASHKVLIDTKMIVDSILSSSHLPAYPDDTIITCDSLPMIESNPQQLQLVFYHLLSNAILYRASSGALNITLGAELVSSPESTYWCIYCTDNGIGINPEFADHIFLPFRRLHSWEHISGTGMGLAICYRIAKLHGGSLSVKSTFGMGSSFYLTLPQPSHGKNTV